MNAAKLMATLVELEALAGKGDPMAMRLMILDAQEGVLCLERQLMATLEINERLKEQLEVCREFSFLRQIELGGESDNQVAIPLVTGHR
jgi:hypothetical protein